MHASHNHSAPSLSRGSTIGGLPDIPALRALRRRCSATSSRAPSTRRTQRLEPARIGSAVGHAPGLSGNRVQRERPVDDSITVIRVDRANGDPLAAVVSFAVHPITVGGSSVLWDTDYIGAAARRPSRPRSPASSASSSRAAPATSRRSTTGGSATRRRAAHGYEARDRLGRGHRRGGARALSRRSRRRDDARVAADSKLLELRRRRHAVRRGRDPRPDRRGQRAARGRLAGGLGAGGAHDDLRADVPGRLQAHRPADVPRHDRARRRAGRRPRSR